MAAFQVAGLTRTTAAIQAVVGAFLAVAHRVIGDENTQKNHSASQNVAAPHRRPVTESLDDRDHPRHKDPGNGADG